MRTFQEFLTESVNFRKGDHVHQIFQGATSGLVRGGHNPANYKHGEVVHHSATHVKVRWEDGTHTTHKQSDGIERGVHGYDGHKAIHHNKTLDPKSKPMTNSDHKRHLIKMHAKDQ